VCVGEPDDGADGEEQEPGTDQHREYHLMGLVC
jgi:hypothetical protein